MANPRSDDQWSRTDCAARIDPNTPHRLKQACSPRDDPGDA
jgi:hypothetical protein